MSQPTILIASVDTEEDNWAPTRTGITVANILELPRQEAFFRQLGVRATYFTTYQVVNSPRAVEILGEIVSGGHSEVGAHLHPWNTPPLDETFTPRNTMLKNLPGDLQLAKLKSLTGALRSVSGRPPVAFRAGRWALGPETVRALVRCGYRIDSSVTPFIDWTQTDGGTNFDGAPLHAYRIGGNGDLRIPNREGPLLEVPVSCGFSRSPFGLWAAVFRALTSPFARRIHVSALATRARLVRRLRLAPEIMPVQDMLGLSRRLLDHGLPYLHVHWHSPSLCPGLSPFVKTPADVDRFYASIEAFVEGLSGLTRIRFATISEAAASLESHGRS